MTTRRKFGEEETLVVTQRGEEESGNGVREVQKQALMEKILKNKTMSVKNLFLMGDDEDSVIDNPRDSNELTGSLGRAEMRAFILDVMEKEFPLKDNIPTARDVINIGPMKKNRAKYSPGSWVETEGPDLIWRLDMITRVIKQAPDDFDWNAPENEGKEPNWIYTYNFGNARDFDEDELRSPEEGLKLLFGLRPWIWQQWAMLKLAEDLRFQEGHQQDFMEKDVQKFAADLWDQWLEHPDNADFRKVFYDERIGKFGRTELVDHIQKPFELIERITEDKKEFDFSGDSNISVFTYLSMLGAGTLVPIIILAIQVAIPAVLVFDVSQTPICEEGVDKTTTIKAMSLVIYIFYLFSVLPDTIARFYDVEGAADSTYSRLISLRRQIWEQGDDSLTQMLGFRLDIYMNTAYESLLYLLNIYIIMNINESLEILLNALAFVFIAKIDEEIVKSQWWDPKQRWITAGAIENVMRSSLRLRWLSSSMHFSQNYGIPEEDLLNAVSNGDYNLLNNKAVSMEDHLNPKYMTEDEYIVEMFRQVAKEVNNTNALSEYEKPKVYCGILETFMAKIGMSVNPVFEDFSSYYTWSRWDKLLFMAKIPDFDDFFDELKSGEHVLSKDLEKIIPQGSDKAFANFYPNEEGLSKSRIFVLRIVKNLRDDLWRGIWMSLSRDKPVFRIIFYLVNYIVQILALLMIFLFPIFLLYAVADIIYQLIYGKCLPSTYLVSALDI